MFKSSLEILQKIVDNGFSAYIVGGFVRDYIMKLDSVDVDICTDATPKDLLNIFNDAILPKEKYGAVTLKYQNLRVEITTFRKELKYENRKPVEIEYTNSLEEDIKRRDFTINSLCMDKDGVVVDLFNGRKDIDKKIIMTLGDPDKKFIEDPLRILRAVRFATTLNFKLDESVINSIKSNAHYLLNISYDRKKSELNKIFASKNIKYGIKLLNSLGLDKYLDLFNLNKIKYTSDILGIWAILDVCDKYPFTKLERETIGTIQTIVKNKTISKYDIYKYGLYSTSIAAEILGINKKVIVKLERNLKIRSRNDINISASEILSMFNKEPGAWVSNIYNDVELRIINGKLKNDNDKIKDYIVRKYM